MPHYLDDPCANCGAPTKGGIIQSDHYCYRLCPRNGHPYEQLGHLRADAHYRGYARPKASRPSLHIDAENQDNTE